MKTREILGWLIAAALLAPVVAACQAKGEAITGTVRVVDGDSLHVGNTEVRLFGVDAFEGSQACLRDGSPWRCGEAATEALRALTDGRAVTCSKKDTDAYGRAVSVCSNGTVDLGAELTRGGLALAYGEFSADYVDEEDDARAARRGAWTGEFTAPWDARRARDAHRTDPRTENHSVASTCRGTGIKGNISSKGERRIYHVPGSSSYDSTVIDELNGERWFCEEDEARRAGWRPPGG